MEKGKLTEQRELSADLQRHLHNIARLERIVKAAEWVIDEAKCTLHDIRNNTDQMILKNMNRKRVDDVDGVEGDTGAE